MTLILLYDADKMVKTSLIDGHPLQILCKITLQSNVINDVTK